MKWTLNAISKLSLWNQSKFIIMYIMIEPDIILAVNLLLT